MYSTKFTSEYLAVGLRTSLRQGLRHPGPGPGQHLLQPLHLSLIFSHGLLCRLPLQPAVPLSPAHPLPHRGQHGPGGGGLRVGTQSVPYTCVFSGTLPAPTGPASPATSSPATSPGPRPSHSSLCKLNVYIYHELRSICWTSQRAQYERRKIGSCQLTPGFWRQHVWTDKRGQRASKTTSTLSLIVLCT